MESREHSLVEVPPEGFDEAAPQAGRRIAPAAVSLPRFVGLAPGGPLDRAVRVESFADFAKTFSAAGQPGAGPYLEGARLAHAVRGFFGNGGTACIVVRAAGVPGSAPLADHLGAEGEPRGLALVLPLDGTSAVAAPDAHGLAGGAEDCAELHRAMVMAAETTTGGMAVLDGPDGLDSREAEHWRYESAPVSPAAVLYHPWLSVTDPLCGDVISVPPCGHALGTWARVDRRFGPHRAPTGEPLLTIDGVAAALDAADQRALNRAGINCARAWPGPEPRLWGARTLSDEPGTRYLHHRRLAAHMAASIAEGTSWASGQAGAAQVRQKVRAAVIAYLANAWRRGALHGATPAQAFFVSCDESGEEDGSLVIEVGLALRQPADFEILRIVQTAG